MTAQDISDVERIFRQITSELQSPWRTRETAAQYAGCSPSDIDKAANMGHITRYFWMNSPRFKTTEIDEAIQSGKMMARKPRLYFPKKEEAAA